MRRQVVLLERGTAIAEDRDTTIVDLVRDGSALRRARDGRVMDVVTCPEVKDAVVVVTVRPSSGHPLVRCPRCGHRYELVGSTLRRIART